MKTLVLSLFLSLSLFAAASNHDTVVDIAINNDGFSTLVAAVQAADLVETLSGDGPFTVFAPTDEAFAAALEALGLSAEELLASDGLADILTYHVVAGNLLAEDVIAAVEEAGGVLEVETVNGAPIFVTLEDGNVVINGVAVVTTADLTAGNGVVHVINAVLLPSVQAASEVTIVLDNAGSSAWVLESVSGAEGVGEEGAQNATLNLMTGMRYTFDVSSVNSSFHPLDFRDASGNILLAQGSTSGSFEGDSDVAFEESENMVSFTLTEELAAVLSAYRCTAHPSMRGDIVTGM